MFPLEHHLSEGKDNVENQLFAPCTGQLVFPLQRGVQLRVQGEGTVLPRQAVLRFIHFLGCQICALITRTCVQNAEYFLF